MPKKDALAIPSPPRVNDNAYHFSLFSGASPAFRRWTGKLLGFTQWD
jgi:hypothetical protein